MISEQPIAQIHYPESGLKHWVESYIILSHRAEGIQDDLPWTIMPDCSGYMIFHLLKNHSRLSLVGPRSVFKNINRKNRILTIVVKFKPWGMSGILSFPVSELKDYSIPLSDIFGDSANILKDKLDELARNEDIRSCLNEIEHFLLNNSPKQLNNLRVVSLSNVINQELGKISIKTLADEVGISDRYLRKIFLSQVGLSPKRFSMVTRVTSIVKNVDGGITKNWADLALGSGYFDQSHLIEDFNLLLGESPEVFIHRSNREEII